MKSAVLYLLALAFQFYKLWKFRHSVNWYKKLITQIQALDVESVRQLKTKIGDGIYKIGDYVLCRGRLASSQPMKSLLDPKRSVAYSQLVMNKIFQIGDTSNTVRRMVRRMYSGYLKLYQGRHQIKVYETMQSNIITSKTIDKARSFQERIFNFGWLVSLLLRAPTRTVSNIYYQSFIPNFSENTVLGKVFKNSAGQIQIWKPMTIAPRKQDMLMFYEDELFSNQLYAKIIIFTIAITFYMIYIIFIKPKLEKRSLLRSKQQLGYIQKIEVKDLNCSKCHATLSNIINSPCGHLAICVDCNAKQVKCLECDKKPKEAILVFPC